MNRNPFASQRAFLASVVAQRMALQALADPDDAEDAAEIASLDRVLEAA